MYTNTIAIQSKFKFIYNTVVYRPFPLLYRSDIVVCFKTIFIPLVLPLLLANIQSCRQGRGEGMLVVKMRHLQFAKISRVNFERGLPKYNLSPLPSHVFSPCKYKNKTQTILSRVTKVVTKTKQNEGSKTKQQNNQGRRSNKIIKF